VLSRVTGTRDSNRERKGRRNSYRSVGEMQDINWTALREAAAGITASPHRTGKMYEVSSRLRIGNGTSRRRIDATERVHWCRRRLSGLP